ncbi:unnamed protein product [Aphanomyces euteiches]
MENSIWDIAMDLPFLVREDNDLSVYGDDCMKHLWASLHEELASQDSLYEIPPRVNQTLKCSKTMVEDPIKGNAFQKRQKKELRHLKAQAEVLSIHLKTINRPVRRVRDSTKWQRVARAELKAKLRAMAENELLKADITTNKAFIVEMEKFIQKKSSSTQGALLSEQWMQCKLVAHPSYRLKAIHAIADRQYGRMQTAFINANLLGMTCNLFSIVPIRMANEKATVQLINHAALPVPYDRLSKATWQVFQAPLASDTCQATIECIDANVVYEQAVEAKHGCRCYSNTISKLYKERGRDVIAWRSVLEDELVPQMTSGSVANHVGWYFKFHRNNADLVFLRISFSALENPNQTRLTLLMEIVADASASAPPHLKIDASIDRIMALIRSEFMSQQVCRVPSQVHPLPASRILPPNLRTYLERARRLEALMWEAVHQVMDYHTYM